MTKHLNRVPGSSRATVFFLFVAPFRGWDWADDLCLLQLRGPLAYNVHHKSMNRICVRIDRERLRERLSRERGVSLTAFEVVQWLHRNGFVLEGVWQCDHEDAVKKLKPDEILEFVRARTEDGITFIEHEKPDRRV